MPQKARLQDGTTVQAWQMDDNGWSAARHAAKANCLWMSCCGSPGVAKTSHRGFRFFAHKKTPARQDCDWVGESVLHERLKAAACLAAQDLGYDAETEVTSPDGDWRADCLIRDRDGSTLMVVEVQLTRISATEINDRHAKIRRRSPLSCWFLGKAFTTDIEEKPDRPVTILPPGDDDALAVLRRRLQGILTGKLIWQAANDYVEKNVPFRLVGLRHRCVSCATEFAWHPVVQILNNEAVPHLAPEGIWTGELPKNEVIAALARYRKRTGMRTAKVVERLFSLWFRCPKCGMPTGPSPIGPSSQRLWPGRVADGITTRMLKEHAESAGDRVDGWRERPRKRRPWVEYPPSPAVWAKALSESRKRAAKKAESAQIAARASPSEICALSVSEHGVVLPSDDNPKLKQWKAYKDAWGQARAAMLLSLARQKLGEDDAAIWIDTPVDLLDGATPREVTVDHSTGQALAEALLEIAANNKNS